MNTPEFSSYKIPEREVLLDENERHMIGLEAGDLIQWAFIFNDHTEHIETTDRVILYADSKHAPNSTFRSLMPRVYNQATIEQSKDHLDDETFLNTTKITLTNSAYPVGLRTEFVIQGDEDDYEDILDVKSPQYYLFTPAFGEKLPEEQIPLDYEAAIDLLRGLVQQAYPERELASELLIHELVRQLIDSSTEVKHTRQTKFRIRDPRNVGSLVISALDTYTNAPGKEPQHYSHAVRVETTTPLHNNDTAITILDLHAQPDNTSARFGITIHHCDDPTNRFEQYENLARTELQQYNDPGKAFPSKFGKKIIDALKLLAQQPTSYESTYIHTGDLLD